jgi:hypothetical protein
VRGLNRLEDHLDQALTEGRALAAVLASLPAAARKGEKPGRP